MAAALVVLVLAVYAPVRGHGFVNFDDTQYVSENPHVVAGLTWPAVKWAFTTTHAGNWHPVTWLSHMLDVQLFGLDAGAHHVTNVVLHAANSLLLFWLWLRMTGALGRSAFVAALFAVHPLHVESVAWIAERKDVLSAFFGLLCLLAYHAYARDVSLRRGAKVLVLQEDREPVAFAQLEGDGAAAEITHVYVHPDYRGAGRGTAVTRAAVEAAGDLQDLWITADAEDRPKKLYARLGFRPAWVTMEFLQPP